MSRQNSTTSKLLHTTRSESSTLDIAEKSFLEGPPPKQQQARWVTDVNFHQTRHVIGQAFAGTTTVAGEPFFMQMFKSLKFASDQERIDLITFVMSYHIAESNARNAKFFAKMMPEDELASTVVIYEYDPSKKKTFLDSWAKQLRFFWVTLRLLGELPDFVTSGEPKKRESMKKLTQTLEDMDQTMIKGHQEFGPKCKHWYISMVGTHPTYRGQGHGAELMQRVNQLADEAQMECLLEAGEPNVRLYEKFGYRVFGKKPLKSQFDETPSMLNFMVRSPAQ